MLPDCIYNEDAMTGPMCRTIGGRGDVIGMAFGAVGEASSSVLVHAKACAEAISKEAMSEGDVDAVTKDTGSGWKSNIGLGAPRCTRLL